jgi:hypothetical protein
VWRRAAWAALFFYVLFAFGCSAMSDSAIGIKDEADGCCVTLPKCVGVQKFKIYRDCQFLGPQYIEFGFGDDLGCYGKETTGPGDNFIDFNWLWPEKRIAPNERGIIERHVSIYRYIPRHALSGIDIGDVPSSNPEAVITSNNRVKDWRRKLLSEHEVGFFVTKHDIKLPLHDVQLAIKDYVLRDANAYGYESQDSNGPSSSRRTNGRTIGGCLFFLLGAAFLKIAFEIFDDPRAPRWLWLGGYCLGFGSVLLVIQGTILVLTGDWLP